MFASGLLSKKRFLDLAVTASAMLVVMDERLFVRTRALASSLALSGIVTSDQRLALATLFTNR
jgi:hypothetical protein